MTDKMEFQQQEIIDAVTKNRFVRVSLKKIYKKKPAVVIYSLVEAIYRGIFREAILGYTGSFRPKGVPFLSSQYT